MTATRTRAALLLLALAQAANAEEWSRFRGPDGSGVLETSELPVEVGAGRNVAWKVALPPGHSSPVLAGGRLFLTGFEGERLVTLAVRSDDGEILWRRSLVRPREQRRHANNNPASPTPVSDGSAVYAFFPDFGLVAYSRDGEELWRLPLGPFRNFQGVANSPVLAGDMLVQVCDQDAGSFLVLVDKATGNVLRRVARHGPSYSSPVVRERGGDCEIVVAGNAELAGYDCRSAERRWWVSGLPFQPKASPIVATIDGEEIAVFHAQSVDDLERTLPPFPKWLSEHDTDGDGRLTPRELPFSEMLDSDGDGLLAAAEYAEIRRQAAAPHTLFAVRLGGRGDLTGAVLWRDDRSIPNVPTPIVYRNVLYVLKEGGILSSLDPLTGALHKRARLTGALGAYYASPVASGGRLYLASLEGHVVAVTAAPQWKVESIGSLDEPIFATPAISQGRLYVRTSTALYCFSAGGR
jgi:outer membrane protein assembly factor BamB